MHCMLNFLLHWKNRPCLHLRAGAINRDALICLNPAPRAATYIPRCWSGAHTCHKSTFISLRKSTLRWSFQTDSSRYWRTWHKLIIHTLRLDGVGPRRPTTHHHGHFIPARLPEKGLKCISDKSGAVTWWRPSQNKAKQHCSGLMTTKTNDGEFLCWTT